MQTGGAGAGAGTASGASSAPAGDGGTQQGGEGTGTGPDLAAMQQTLESQAPVMEQMREFLASEPWKPQEAPQTPQAPAEPEIDLGFLDDPATLADPEALQSQLLNVISQQVKTGTETALKEHLDPLKQEWAEDRRERMSADLLAEFPEMGEEDTQEKVLTAAAQLAQHLGVPNMAGDPRMWRVTYLMGRALDAAQEEQGDIPAAAHLESGTGALPGGTTGGDLGDVIVGGGSTGRRGAGALPFQ